MGARLGAAPMPAPTQHEGERDADFLRRVVMYLTIPHRRRLGRRTANDMLGAVRRLEQR